jgi:hypothetical protein
MIDDVRSEHRGREAVVPMKDKDGRSVLVVILKYTFAVDPSGFAEIPDDPHEVRFVDECWGDDLASSSIKKPSDLFDTKPGTDVILVGHAYPPSVGATHVDVSLRVGPVAKTVRAHGLRVWIPGSLGGLAAGPSRPVREPVPLKYELAWGGIDLSNPERIVGEARNYAGRGVAADPQSLIDQPAAQLEDPSRPFGGRSNVPWSFGPIHRHWEPRKSFSGTYDEAWMEMKMPYLPDDFDPRFHVCVPPEQWSQVPLRGDEPIEIVGARPEGPWRFRLPRVAPGFLSSALGREQPNRTWLDTLLIDADLGRVELTWRASIPLPKKYEQFDYVKIGEKTVV